MKKNIIYIVLGILLIASIIGNVVCMNNKTQKSNSFIYECVNGPIRDKGFNFTTTEIHTIYYNELGQLLKEKIVSKYIYDTETAYKEVKQNNQSKKDNKYEFDDSKKMLYLNNEFDFTKNEKGEEQQIWVKYTIDNYKSLGLICTKK